MYYICIENGRDGFGYQLYHQIYSIILAKKFKINYCYRPMGRIGHNYENNSSYEDDLNKFTNLEKMFTQPYIDKTIHIKDINQIQKIIESNEAKDINILIFVRKLSNRMYCFQKLFWKYREKHLMPVIDNFLKDKENPFHNKKINISIHIRSGDILMDKKRIDYSRFTPDSYYIKLCKFLHHKFQNKDYLIHLFFESKSNIGFGDTNLHKINDSIFNINSLLDKNVILHENGDLKKDFLMMVFADYLFVAKSSFSVMASFFNKNKSYAFNDFHQGDFGGFKDIKIIDPQNINL